VNRLTKQIRLVLISSSLVLPGCGPQWSNGPRYMPRSAGGPRPVMPTACGPADGQYGGPVERCEAAAVDGSGEYVESSGGYNQGSGGYDPNAGSYHPGYPHHVGGYPVPIIIPGRRVGPSGSYVDNGSGASGFSGGRVGSAGGSTWSHTSSSGGGRSSIGSVRGGFGSSGHAVSS
jgi:hypothetical protein